MEQPCRSISHEAIYQYIYHPETEGGKGGVINQHKAQKMSGL